MLDIFAQVATVLAILLLLIKRQLIAYTLFLLGFVSSTIDSYIKGRAIRATIGLGIVLSPVIVCVVVLTLRRVRGLKNTKQRA